MVMSSRSFLSLGPEGFHRIAYGAWGSAHWHFFETNTALAVNRVTSRGMRLDSATPMIAVDTETCAVRAGGEPLICKPAQVLPMAQR